MSAAKKRRKKSVQMPILAPVIERPPIVIPDWYAEPVVVPLERPRRSFFSGNSNASVRQIIEGFGAGHYGMPPWQRGAVWTREQRIKLLDSIIRGASIGPITLWRPPMDSGIEAKNFDGCTYQAEGLGCWGGALVVDGQQRLTTLLMASRGEIGVRWNGAEWTDGPGFMTEAQPMAINMSDLLGWDDVIHESPHARRMYEDLEAVRDYQITFMTLDGSAADMVETYRRLATCGTPHSVEDLGVMESWLAGR